MKRKTISTTIGLLMLSASAHALAQEADEPFYKSDPNGDELLIEVEVDFGNAHDQAGKEEVVRKACEEKAKSDVLVKRLVKRQICPEPEELKVIGLEYCEGGKSVKYLSHKKKGFGRKGSGACSLCVNVVCDLSDEDGVSTQTVRDF